MTPNNPWDPAQYDASFGFVAGYGERVLELLGDVAGLDVLDLGCGTAHLTAQLAAAGARPVGLDLSEEMVAAARSAHPDLDIRIGDGQRMTLQSLDRDRAFDAVFSNAALHWMPDGAAVAAAVRGVLRAGGRFAAELGGQDNVSAVDSALRTSLADLGLEHIELPRQNFPSPAVQARWLEAAGFRVRLLRWYERPTPLRPGQSAADWTHHFRAMVWQQVPSEAVADLRRQVDVHSAAAGLREGGWHIDYCRLQFLAQAR